MTLYNLIEYSDNYEKTSEKLYEYYSDELVHNISDSKPFKFKSRFIDKTDSTATMDVKIAILLKYVCKFWRTFEALLINTKINLI